MNPSRLWRILQGIRANQKRINIINDFSYYDVFFPVLSGWRLRENHEWRALTTATEDVTTFTIPSVYLLQLSGISDQKIGYFPYQLLIISIFFSQFQVKEARKFKWAICYNIVSKATAIFSLRNSLRGRRSNRKGKGIRARDRARWRREEGNACRYCFRHSAY